MCPCLLAVWLLASSNCESNFRQDSSLQFPFEQGGVLSRSTRVLSFVPVPGYFIAEDAVQNTVPLRDDSPVSLRSFSFHHLQVVMMWSPAPVGSLSLFLILHKQRFSAVPLSIITILLPLIVFLLFLPLCILCTHRLYVLYFSVILMFPFSCSFPSGLQLHVCPNIWYCSENSGSCSQFFNQIESVLLKSHMNPFAIIII